MALKYLTTGEMVSLSGSWTEKGHPDRRILQSIPSVAVIMAHVDAAHGALLLTQRNPEQERLAGISTMEGAVDLRHDNLARGIWHGLEAYKYLAQNEETAEDIDTLQQDLYPIGLKVVQLSYRETAGQGVLLASRLTPEQKGLLASLPIEGGTMLDQVQAWIETAERLGELENERTRLTKPLPSGSAARARNQWIRAIHAVRTIIELEGTVAPEVQRLLQRIADAEATAARRLRDGADTGADTDLDDGAGDGVDDSIDDGAGAGAENGGVDAAPVNDEDDGALDAVPSNDEDDGALDATPVNGEDDGALDVLPPSDAVQPPANGAALIDA